MIRILVEGHEAVARTARELFPLADKASDEPTADLLTQRLTVHEQTAWMLRSLLEDRQPVPARSVGAASARHNARRQRALCIGATICP